MSEERQSKAKVLNRNWKRNEVLILLREQHRQSFHEHSSALEYKNVVNTEPLFSHSLGLIIACILPSNYSSLSVIIGFVVLSFIFAVAVLQVYF